nr:MAG TPA: hypothetical protein [Caudoviricetes sp.]
MLNVADKKEYLGENGIKRIRQKVFEKAIKSTEIREIKIVTEYPEVEETGVLYLKVEE